MERKKTLEDPPKTYTSRELDEARHQGYQLAEQLYSLQIKKLKEQIKRLENGNP